MMTTDAGTAHAGGGMTIAGNLIADPAFRHEIEALHRLGPRVTGELIADLAHRHGPDVRTRMVTFAALDSEILAELDALLWPPLPLYRVPAADYVFNDHAKAKARQ